MIVIAFAGPTSAGKDTIADILAEKGFKKMSLSDILRKLAKDKNVAIDAESLFNLSKPYKEKLGEGFLGKMILDEFKAKQWEKTCAVGLRRFGEWEEIQKADKAYLIYVDAPLDVCFARAQARSRAGDKTSFEDFKNYEAKLSSVGLKKLKEQADFIVSNTGSLDELQQMVEKLAEKIV
jgi:dephospho-CoA kinase